MIRIYNTLAIKAIKITISNSAHAIILSGHLNDKENDGNELSRKIGKHEKMQLLLPAMREQRQMLRMLTVSPCNAATSGMLLPRRHRSFLRQILQKIRRSLPISLRNTVIQRLTTRFCGAKFRLL